MKRRKGEKNPKFFLFVTCFVCLVLIFIVIFVLFRISKRSNLKRYIKNDVELELGTNLTIDAFLNEPQEKAFIDKNLDFFDAVGEYKVKIKIQGETFYTNLKVIDTVAPFLEVKDLTIYNDEDLPLATDFVKRIIEFSNYTIEPIHIERQEGEQEVKICVKDESGNTTTKNAKLTIKPNDDGPVFKGLSPLTVEIGQKVDITDDVTAITRNFKEVSFIVNDSKVNYSKVGTYEIYYTAQDDLGNKTTEKRSITITPKDTIVMIPDFSLSESDTYGSELGSLYQILKFYQTEVTLEQMVEKLKKGDGVVFKNGILKGGNPEIEYVGNPLENGFGVYQAPILELANNYRPGMIDFSGHSLDEVLQLVLEGKPVQVWVSDNLEPAKSCATWNYQEENIEWYCNLTSVVIIGYHSNGVYVSVPSSSEVKEFSKSQFESIFDFFGKRAIYYDS